MRVNIYGPQDRTLGKWTDIYIESDQVPAEGERITVESCLSFTVIRRTWIVSDGKMQEVRLDVRPT